MIRKYEAELPFGIAYWHKKRRWVIVPFFYIPEGALAESDHLIPPIDGKQIESITIPDRQVGNLIRESIVPELWSDKELKQICNRNNIPLSCVTDRFPIKGGNRRGDVIRRRQRKIKSLSSKEYPLLLKEVKKINKQTAIIVQILWFLNKSLNENGFVTLEELLRLKVEDIILEKEGGFYSIHLQRTGFNGPDHVFHYLPTYIWRLLNNQIHGKSMFIFSNKKGGSLLPRKINNHLRRAGKLAGIEEIVSSLALRPLPQKRIQPKTMKLQTEEFTSDDLSPITPEEWDPMSKNPLFISKAGRKTEHSLCDKLNAILYLKKNRLPIRKLPSSFPPWKAVDSQRRRWEKKGLLQEIFKLLRIIRTPS